MSKLVRYGKPAGPLLEQKQSFFTENDVRLAEARRWAALYAEQPPRTACKNCRAPLGGPDFVKLGVGYAACARCGHLNGLHEDTADYCAALYTEDGGESYGRTYGSKDRAAYDKRRDDIYVPKARFLAEALASLGEDPAGLSYADFGAGSGYFVAALTSLGLANVTGYEVSESQVRLANAMLGEQIVTLHGPEESVELAQSVRAGVVGMIGVLEHLRDPRAMLTALSANPEVRYLFFSVPLYSVCVHIETAFPNVMPRQLTAGHTHLYTESSIDWFCDEFGFERTAEWWFGTDLVDLYRSLLVSLRADPDTTGAADHFDAAFRGAIDATQMALDERRLSSEVHMLLAKR